MNGINAVLAPTIRLSSGYDIPVVGLGTGGIHDDAQTVKYAIDCGYRHFDTALVYHNEIEVGKGINAKIDEGVVKREDIFITTKVEILNYPLFWSQLIDYFDNSLKTCSTIKSKDRSINRWKI